jgi:hypothetical protein
MSTIQSNWAPLGCRSALRCGTARFSTVRSIEYRRHGNARTARPTHSRRVAFAIARQAVEEHLTEGDGLAAAIKRHIEIGRKRSCRRQERARFEPTGLDRAPQFALQLNSQRHTSTSVDPEEQLAGRSGPLHIDTEDVTTPSDLSLIARWIRRVRAHGGESGTIGPRRDSHVPRERSSQLLFVAESAASRDLFDAIGLPLPSTIGQLTSRYSNRLRTGGSTSTQRHSQALLHFHGRGRSW